MGLLLHFLLLIGNESAQDNKLWLGTRTRDVARAEADKLGWDAPHGPDTVASRSPAGLKLGDIIDGVDDDVEMSSDALDPVDLESLSWQQW